MKKFEEAVFTTIETAQTLKAKFGKLEKLTDEEWEVQAQRLMASKVYLNDEFQVTKEVLGPIIHLSIKRIDREVIRDWRILQEIKNQLLGPEWEAVELFPAESRLVDTSNQYHLWACNDANYRFPFGYPSRLVIDGDGKVGLDGTRQRPFNKGDS